MMATRSRQAMQNGKRPKESNVWQRVLDLPVVNSACSSLWKTYTATKEVHPLMASVCGAYERGLQNATSLATWSIRPVIQRLEPQLATANLLACRGLDNLERKIPALHQPVEKVTADLKASVFTRIQNTSHALMGFFSGLWEVAAKSYEQSENRVKDTLEHVRRSRVSVVAEAGIDATTGKLENVIDFFLQKAEEQSVHESAGATKEESPATLFGKVRVFTVATFQWAYDQTLQIFQEARDRGWEMAGLTAKGPEHPSLLGSLAQNLQTAYLSMVLLVKSTPSLAWNAAGQLLRISSVREAASEAGAKPGILQSVTGKLLGTLSRYNPLPKHTEKEDATPGLTGDHPDSTGEQERAPSEAALALEGWGLSQGQDARRLSRGHYPLPFINLDDPLPPQPATSGRLAFSPYKEGAGRRRWSEGLFRFSPEAIYQRAQYAGLYGTPFKKD